MAKTKTEAPNLVKALNFVAVAQKDKGAPYQTHVILRNNTAIATDGILSAGHMIDEDLNACPHTMTLLAALGKCKTVLAVTQLNSGKISIKSGAFKALVPCSPDGVIPNIVPDAWCGVLDDRIRHGLELVGPFIVENSQRVIMASALLKANTIIATNGHILLEYWHGIDLPPGLIIPKLFITALSKIDKKLTGFGFSQASFTVYFEDNSWLKTQLYVEKWPDTSAIMERPHNPTALPVGFFDGLGTVQDFIEDGRVRIRPGKLQSHDSPEVGAQYDLEGLTSSVTLNAKHLKLLEGIATAFDFVGHKQISYFYGDSVRGAITQFKEDGNAG